MNQPVPSNIVQPGDVGKLGFDPQRLSLLTQAVPEDIAACRYDGARLILGRRGTVVLDCTIGYNNRDKGQALKSDNVFCIMSRAGVTTLTKTIALDYARDRILANVLMPAFISGHGRGACGHRFIGFNCWSGFGWNRC